MRLDPQLKERLKQTFTQGLVAQKELVRVFSTYQLSSEELQKILAQFPQYEGREVENRVDTSILGGFVVQSGSQTIDLSIRNALHLLKKQLYESN